MSKITYSTVSDNQVDRLLLLDEGQFSDLKGRLILPSKLSKTISAFSNSDGGDLYVGIDEAIDRVSGNKVRTWLGFDDVEAANPHLQVFEQLFPLGLDYQYDFLSSDNHPGVVLHVQINKTKSIMKASNDMPYVRRGAQNLPVQTQEAYRNLEYSKGISSFEGQTVTDVAVDVISESEVIDRFISDVVPTTTPEKWLKKQQLIKADIPTVAGVLLFADEPQAIVPKHCGIKIYRYKTNESEGFREALAFVPLTVEGDLYSQIHDAVEQTSTVVEEIPKLSDSNLQNISYPSEAIHEIITNAVIHRDYSIADDVHIRIFDNRVEVESPGRLAAHMTVDNILEERFARNGAIVRILNKFPNPPAEETIMDYLETNESINNKVARSVCHIPRDYRVKTIFVRMVKNGLIEQVPGTNTSSTAYQKKISKS